eukprot:GFUD01138386.1.p1 GENE.GFUD01138386.1~~GFUD01138386.1.p1  ORF type:complete len:506 (+),score=138.74 GFUD01138386.1:120-1637(+)
MLSDTRTLPGQSLGTPPATGTPPLVSPPPSPARSLVWLSGPVCSPARLCLATLFSVRSLLNTMALPPFKSADWVILSIISVGTIVLYLASTLAQSLLAPPPGESLFWLLSLLLNMIGYATIFVPGYYVIKYVRKTNYLETGPASLLQPLVRLFVKGAETEVIEVEAVNLIKGETEAAMAKTVYQEGMILMFCAGGLLGSYSTWGYLQEKIMTTNYVDSLGNKGKFNDSQFLVFVNRILAFALALLVIMIRRQPRHKAPLFKYSYCSFSNIMSSWCQYEALKYVSFPTQVLAKASKVIPVMLMGKVVSNKKYEYYEYVVALLISVGMVAFLMGNDDGNKASNATTFSGFIILIGYMAFDAFTSNWQGELFTEYKMTSFQMMAGVNLFSCLLTSVSLMQQGVFYTSLAFMSQYSRFMLDCIILSICSASGQLFIYYTISVFGPVAFVIIMTVRQVFAVVLSCILFQHALAPVAIIGIFIIFSALFLKIYCSYRLKMKKKTVSAAGKI